MNTDGDSAPETSISYTRAKPWRIRDTRARRSAMRSWSDVSRPFAAATRRNACSVIVDSASSDMKTCADKIALGLVCRIAGVIMAYAGTVGNLGIALGLYYLSCPLAIFFTMYNHCVHCGADLPEPGNFCPACGEKIPDNADPLILASTEISHAEPALTEQQLLIRERMGPGGWGLWSPALGIFALVPTAILVSLLALVLPLSTTTVIAAVTLGGVQLGLVWILTSRTWPVDLGLYGLRTPRMPYWRTIIACLLVLGASLGAIQLYVMATTFVGIEILVPADLPSDLVLPGALSILTVIALAVITPIAEEVFFRGFVLRGLVNRWGMAPAIIVSAAVFAGLHFQPSIIIPVFITGLLLGALYWQTGSIWPGIGVHAGQNLIATLGVVVGL